ncbi:hypothetical protein BH23CHL5_BH23CHL5_18930 [soil metagenome]
MPEEISQILADVVTFFAKIGWIVIIGATTIWVTGRVRQRLRKVVDKRGIDHNLALVIDNIVRFAVYLVLGLLLIGALTGNAGSAVTAIGLTTAAISLSLQDVLRNFASGIYLLIEKPFVLGDTIRVADQRGEVERVDIRATVIRNDRHEQVFVPNFKVFSEIVRKRTDVESHRYLVTSPYPVHESYDAISSAAMSLQTSEHLKPSIRIVGADQDTIDFDIVLLDPAGTVRSDAFIAAVKASLEKATVKLNDE